MAISFVSGSSMYAKNSSAPIVGGTPLSIAGWWYAVGGSSGVLAQIQDDGSGSQYYRLFTGSTGGNGDIQAYTRNAGSNEFCQSANTYDVDAWNHVAAAWGSSTSRKSWCNAGTATADTGSVTDPTGINSIDFCRAGDSSVDNYRSGYLCDWAVWDGYELTDADVAQLSAGAHPFTIKPHLLTRYWPFAGTGTAEVLRGQDLTMFNTPTEVESLLISRPWMLDWSNSVVAAGGGGATVPIFRQHLENRIRA